MNDLILKKLDNFFNNNFVKNVALDLIFKNPDGSYELFDRYTIEEIENGYTVKVKNTFNSEFFYTLQNAVTYCIFCKYNKIVEAQRIEKLDKIIEGVNFSIKMLNSMIGKSKDTEAQLIYVGKLSEDRAKRQKLINELSGFRKQAMFWQNQKLK